MTFSIVARDPEIGDLGVAVASRFVAVGAVVPWARAGVGAVATQALPNVHYGPDGLDGLLGGAAAEETLAALVAADTQRQHRQAGIVDAAGRAATYTGSRCLPWAGGRTGPGVTVQGNILVGPAVVDAMVAVFEAATGPLPRRLVAALQAGDAVGGDKRGRQSAALLVVREGAGFGGNDRWVDLRVDDHPDPCAELARLLDVHERAFALSASTVLAAIGPSISTELRSRLRPGSASSKDERTIDLTSGEGHRAERP